MSTARGNSIDRTICRLARATIQSDAVPLLDSLIHNLRVLNAAMSVEIDKEEKQCFSSVIRCFGLTKKADYDEIMVLILNASYLIVPSEGSKGYNASGDPIIALEEKIQSTDQCCSELRTLLTLVYNGLVELSKIILCGLIVGSLAAALASPLGIASGFLVAIKSLIIAGMNLAHGGSLVSSIHVVANAFKATGEVAGLTAGALRGTSSLYGFFYPPPVESVNKHLKQVVDTFVSLNSKVKKKSTQSLA